MAGHTLIDIKDLSKEELQRALVDLGHPKYRTQQLFRWLYQKCSGSFEDMSDIGVSSREALKKNFYIGRLELIKKEESQDATLKYLFGLKDANRIESVLIPTAARITVCLSTQVGCRYGCLFCLSGKNGFKRNLTVSEITGQLISIKNNFKEAPVTHIVFMGIGEPLDNYDNVLKAIRIFNDKDGFNIGIRRITISTCGLIPEIKKLFRENLQFELSVSLHASNNKIRDRLMPVNKKYPIEPLMEALREYTEYAKRKITFDYVLIDEVNNSIKDAYNLVRLLKGVDCKVNLIAFNETHMRDFKAPPKHKVLSFKKILEENKVGVTIRRPRGQDINAACGQLSGLSLTGE